MPDDALRFPIGRFAHDGPVTDAQFAQWTSALSELPGRLRAATLHLPDRLLDVPYRPGGWTVRQVVHHVADSHVNGYVRARLALTSDEPAIVPYDEAAWARQPDYQAPVLISLDLLGALHARWVRLLTALPPDVRARAYRHPDNGLVTVERQAGLYAWHGQHHLAHVQNALAAAEQSGGSTGA
jgi:hypothetical protein